MSSDKECVDAAFGLARTSLSLAQVAFDEGKFSQAYSLILNGIEILEQNFSNKSQCFLSVQKCFGDLFSFGFFLPPSVFHKSLDHSITHLNNEQHKFVSKGEDFYRGAIEAVSRSGLNDGDSQQVVTALYCDLVRYQLIHNIFDALQFILS